MTDNNYGNLTQLVSEGKISLRIAERVKLAKSFIEKKYNMKKQKDEKKKKEWEMINTYLENVNLTQLDKEEIKHSAIRKESEFLRKNRKRLSIHQFESIAIIGRGAFGEVCVCRSKENGKIYAIKKMKKDLMKNKNQIFHIKTERDILSSGINNPWITQLHYSFQDEKFLYLVMDFMQGGDLMNLLIKKDTLTEKEAKFYISELILSVESVHKMKCIHRDIKPDNILIDSKGHIKLTDFGLSIISDEIIYPISSSKELQMSQTFNYSNNNSKWKDNIIKRPNRLMAFSRVGTPDYIAPEVFSKKGYGKEVDWWSVGIILFEMLVGFPPFFSDTPIETCQKIINYQKFFKIPPEIQLSPQAIDLIKKFITIADKRLGVNGVEEIKNHPFFNGFDWDNVINMKPPFTPIVSNSFDTRYFDKFKENKNDPFCPPYNQIIGFNTHEKSKTCDKFFGFTFNRDAEIEEVGKVDEIYEMVQVQTKQKILNKSNIDDIGEHYRLESNNSFVSENTNQHEKKRCQTNISKSPDVFRYKRKELNVMPIKNLIYQRKKKEKNDKVNTTANEVKSNLGRNINNAGIKENGIKTHQVATKVTNKVYVLRKDRKGIK